MRVYLLINAADAAGWKNVTRLRNESRIDEKSVNNQMSESEKNKTDDPCAEFKSGQNQKEPVILEPKLLTSATNAKFATDGHCHLQCR